MRKRARLARRILREHRRGSVYLYHQTREAKTPAFEVWGFWLCPRCKGRR